MSDTFNNVFGSMAGSAVGNIAGAGVGYLLEEKSAENQFKRQQQLQRDAWRMNQDAVRRQASNEVTGFQQAGLNPALANGGGVPVTQPGSASVGNVPTIGNIFDGIAQIISAVKSPSEVSKTQAETSQISQKIDLVNPALVEKTQAEVKLLGESVRNSKNLNDAFEAGNKFLKEHSSAMFERLSEKLQQDGTWSGLSPDTQSTILALASGSISLGQGQIEALKKVIDTQANLSDADRRVVQNAFDNVVTLNQFNDEDVMNSLQKLPDDSRKMMYNQMDKISKDIEHINQLIKSEKASEALSYAQKMKTDFERESAELNDVKWLAKKGRFDDVDLRTTEQSLERVTNFLEGMVNTGVNMATGYAVGKGIGSGKTPSPEPPRITPATPQEMMKYNSGRTFGNHLNYSR